ncbi:hypothetical protein BV898_16473 [Hypsibius exemplaris]|uniref:Metallo-beta-lactamase domain-containing protein n=1 Tax=Hypsibius exemplaris TaxID=2072580 RepID=A0A9X6NDB0_HYPEX|nr:hypothetical protein BV898_16473 [Hypsibius exemplaris]
MTRLLPANARRFSDYDSPRRERTLDLEELLSNAARDQIRRARQQSFVAFPVTFSSTAFLVNTKQNLVLIDTGAGSLSGLSFGRLLGNLRASGYEPEQIDHVFLTHLHVGHSGGVQPGSQAGGRTFPNATVRVSQAEVDYWLNLANEAGSSEINK